ncbi:Centromere protein V-like 1 [Homarus americanus]|uniref:Centromere protein V-like 1 n=1 Tax=Homarus americanus TaxID=6706 RepID=A0A8J5MPR8_HOMAM|nr:Centromere protein V-like 1 [Homarus americanus]
MTCIDLPQLQQVKSFIIPYSSFKLVSGHDSLGTYSDEARYNFCSTCGFHTFIPSCNSEVYGIAPHCLDHGTVNKITHKKVDHKNLQ